MVQPAGICYGLSWAISIQFMPLVLLLINFICFYFFLLKAKKNYLISDVIRSMLHAKLRVFQKKFKWDRWLRGYEPWNCFLFVWQQKNHIQKERDNINKARVDLVQHLRCLFTVLFSSYHSLSIQTLASCTLLLNVCFCHLFYFFFSFTFSFFTRVYKQNIYLFETSEIYVHMRENYTIYTLPFLVRWFYM